MRSWILALLTIFFSAGAYGKGPQARPDWPHVEKRLRKEGFRDDFIKALKRSYEPNHFHQVIELNLLLFLKKADYHGVQVGPEAVADVRAFINKNKVILAKTEKDHGVSGSAISSLLWLESRYGVNQGYFHVPSVYIDLLQVERPEVIKHLHKQAGSFTKTITQGTFKEITKRTSKKAKWALDELRALQKMYKKDKTLVLTLRGSFAGAFGWSQFIPSSYVSYARPYKRGTVANLTKPDDAIYSVGYYLKAHGWKKQQKKSHMKALLGYNNSTDYANAILNLAQQVDAPKFRKPSDISDILE